MRNINFNTVFEQFEKLNVAVIGDIMVDAYYTGKVDRISPEAPVPVIQVRNKAHKAGGAANVALNLRSLGATVDLYAVRGNDLDGKMLLETLNNEGITTEHICLDYDRRTTIKTRVIGNNQQVLRIDEEDTFPLSSKIRDSILEDLRSEISKYDVIIFEDYNKGLLTPELIREVIKMARANDVPVVVDPKKENFFEYRNATLFKPNRKEIIDGLGLDSELKNKADIEDAILQLRKQLDPKYVMVTLSEDGVVIHDGEKFHFVPAHSRKIYDVSGAGDTVISVCAVALAVGLPPEAMAELSNLAGGLVCEKPGVVPIDKELLLNEVLRLV